MDDQDWAKLFEHGKPEVGLSDQQVGELLTLISRPLDEEELSWADKTCRRNPFPVSDTKHAGYVPHDPRLWAVPHRGLPASYLSFLRWSNGGRFFRKNHVIEFVPYQGREVNIRNMWLVNLFPLYIPYVVPFGGSPDHGDYYAFDTSQEPIGGEFPVVYIDHEAIWEPMPVADSFPDFCRLTENPERLNRTWRQRGHRNTV